MAPECGVEAAPRPSSCWPRRTVATFDAGTVRELLEAAERADVEAAVTLHARSLRRLASLPAG